MISLCGYHLLKKYFSNDQPLWLTLVKKNHCTYSISVSHLHQCLVVKYLAELKINWTEDPSSNQTLFDSKIILYKYLTDTFPVTTLLGQDRAQPAWYLLSIQFYILLVSKKTRNYTCMIKDKFSIKFIQKVCFKWNRVLYDVQ